MAKTKKEEQTAKELKKLQPKKEAVDAKNLTKVKWNDDLFICYKSYKTSQKEDATFKVEKAHWRNLHVNGVNLVAVQGEFLSKKELSVFDGMSKADRAGFIEEVKTKKADA